MSWFWTLLIFLCFTFSGNYNNLSEAKKHQKKKLSPAAVVGTVYCDTCFRQDLPKASHFIQGASVELVCKDTRLSQSFHKQVETDQNGRFKIDLPFSVSKHVKRIKNCSVKLINSNQQFCSIAAAAESSSLHLKSRKKGVRIFSAGFFSFKPSNQPDLCDRKQSMPKKSPNFLFEKEFMSIANPNDPMFLPPVQNPYNNLPAFGHFLPPLPQLPKLPSLPETPFFPPKADKQNNPQPTDEKLLTNLPMSFPFPPNPFNPIPNPLQPPPSIVPPIIPSPPPSIIPPVFPSPPPSIIPPIFPSPSPPPSIIPPLIPAPPFNLPPVPGLFPSPPPPPPPALPIPLPPVPLVPIPGFPGVPPASKDYSEPKTKSITP